MYVPSVVASGPTEYAIFRKVGGSRSSWGTRRMPAWLGSSSRILPKISVHSSSWSPGSGNKVDEWGRTVLPRRWPARGTGGSQRT